jgi:hypothetical protein
VKDGELVEEIGRSGLLPEMDREPEHQFERSEREFALNLRLVRRWAVG